MSEVYLDDLDDVRMDLAGNDAGIEVVLGNKDVGQRLERALRVLDEKKGSLNNISNVIATSDKSVILGFTTKSAGGAGATRSGVATNPR